MRHSEPRWNSGAERRSKSGLSSVQPDIIRLAISTGAGHSRFSSSLAPFFPYSRIPVGCRDDGDLIGSLTVKEGGFGFIGKTVKHWASGRSRSLQGIHGAVHLEVDRFVALAVVVSHQRYTGDHAGVEKCGRGSSTFSAHREPYS